MMVAAAEGGINYFDTAPGYFDGKSETVFGKGFAELRRRNLPYYAATKTFASTESGIRREIEAQLKRLDVPTIDFYHIWSITALENWQKRKNDGVLTAFRKLKEEGLIRHICVSSHLARDEIKILLMEELFEGLLFGYSFYNFRTRQAAFDVIRELHPAQFCKTLAEHCFAFAVKITRRRVKIIYPAFRSGNHHADTFIVIVNMGKTHPAETQYGNFFAGPAVFSIKHLNL
jgi:aryl-alcohol dehydrogenase-like predicted oxidoreductase